MITIEKELYVNRPVAEVFAYVTQFPNNAEWQQDVLAAESLSEGPVGVGSKASLTRRAMGKELKSEIAVTVCEPGRQFAAKTTSGPVQTEVSNTFKEMAGGTHMSIVAKVEAGGFFKVAEGMLKREIERSMDRDFEKLKGILERR